MKSFKLRMPQKQDLHFILPSLVIVLAVVVAAISIVNFDNGGNREKASEQKQSEKQAEKDKTKKELLDALGAASSDQAIKIFGSKYDINDTKAGQELAKYVAEMDEDFTNISFELIDITTGKGISYAPHKSMYSASTIKGPYIAALNKYKPDSYGEALSSMTLALKESSNEDYIYLRDTYGDEVMAKFAEYCEADGFSSYENYGYIETDDLAKLWVGCYWYLFKETNENSLLLAGLYEGSLNSFISNALSEENTVYSKAGWYYDGGINVQNDAGIVMAKVDGHARPYVLAVMTSAVGQYDRLEKLATLIDKVHEDMLK